MEKVKQIAKYVLNALTIINALLIGLAPIWDIPADKVIQTISVVMAVISTYLLGNKAVKSISERNGGNDEIE
nr:MAG TPA: holin [Caudoviricetes sp.]